MARATNDVIAAAPATWAAAIRGVRVCLESSATENPATAPPHVLLNQPFFLAGRETAKKTSTKQGRGVYFDSRIPPWVSF